MSEPKLCVNCKYCYSYAHTMGFMPEFRCRSPHIGINLVTGVQQTESCTIQRLPSSCYKHCGQDGRYWEAK
jgi:hypothetical protein